MGYYCIAGIWYLGVRFLRLGALRVLRVVIPLVCVIFIGSLIPLGLRYFVESALTHRLVNLKHPVEDSEFVHCRHIVRIGLYSVFVL